MAAALHSLRSAVAVPARRGDFGVSVQGDAVAVSPETFEASRRLNIKTAEALLNVAESLPSSLAGELGWTVEDVQQAVADARHRLIGVIAAEYVSNTPRPPLAFGAFPPLAGDASKGGA